MKPRVLVLGGTGFVGQALTRRLLQEGCWTPVVAARHRPAVTSTDLNAEFITMDIRNQAALRVAMKDIQAVVNCVMSDASSIAQGTSHLTNTAMHSNKPPLVHLSTMSVYGRATGRVTEDHPLQGDAGWYCVAKIEAERHMEAYRQKGGYANILRPGCIYGPGSTMWTERPARWLLSGRLGDLGVAGDGWSNLVHINDVVQAVVHCLGQFGDVHTSGNYNLAAPDSPRWNTYFIDLALALGATPVKRISKRYLAIESQLIAPPLKIAKRILYSVSRGKKKLPEGMPPSLLALWRQDIRLDCTAATRDLGIKWTPYTQGIRDCVEAITV
jgi:nucleoside-diphosphate-sugar epimerase